MPRYIVTLTNDEIQELQALIQKEMCIRDRANTISCCGEAECFQTSYFTLGIWNGVAIYR